MTKEAALDRYSNAVSAIKEHIEANKAVFDAHQKLLNAMIDAENDLRDQVAEEEAGVNNGQHVVTYTRQTQTFADIEVVDRLIAEGKITAPRDEIVKTNQRPPRITIGEIK